MLGVDTVGGYGIVRRMAKGLQSSMPLYDFRCKTCGLVWEDLIAADAPDPSCQCGGLSERLISLPTPILFREGWYNDIDTEPMYISSKKQLRDECRKRGLTSIYAEEW